MDHSSDPEPLLRAGLERALGKEMEVLGRARRKDLPPLREVKLPPVPGEEEEIPRRAVVAADAGNLELRVHPLRVGLVRVALATSRESSLLLQAFLPLSHPLPDLVRFLLDQPGGRGISRALESAGLDPTRPEAWLKGLRPPPGRVLDFLRELLEWLSLLHEANRLASTPGPALVLRDGLLRSIVLPGSLFSPILEALRRATTRGSLLLAALAKRAPGGPDLSHYLSLALPALVKGVRTFPRAFEIPPALEAAFSPASFASQAAKRRAGRLYLLLLSPRHAARPLVAEVPSWQENQAPLVLAHLCRRGSGGFPEPGHPPELLRAHRKAAVSPFEREYFSRLLLEKVLRLRPGLRDALLSAHLSGGGVLALPDEKEQTP